MNKAEKVQEIITDCLFKDEEIVNDETPEDAVLVEGIVRKFGFHPGRLESHKEEIKELLDAMPAEFHAKEGGGWSFLNLCQDKDGEHWAEHPTMEALICLGIGSGMAKYCLEDRELWKVFPGNVPYVQFDTTEKTA